MADSIREQIFKAVKVVLEGVEGIGQVSRGKVTPLSIQRFPAINMVPGTDLPEEHLNDLMDHDMQMFLILWVMAQEEILVFVESFLAKVVKAMAADHRLNGLVINVGVPTVDAVFPADEEQTISGVVIDFPVKYRTRRDDPYAIS